MPGSPKKRARREAAQREAAKAGQPPPPAPPRAAIPEAQSAPAHDAHPRARASERRNPPGVSAAPRVQLGPRTREAVDNATADTLQELGSMLRPGVTLRLERTRPTWCAGWVEDYELEHGEGLRDVYAHVSTEWGGQTYRITVLGLSGQALYQSRLEVAGKPKDAGRILDREEFEGRPSARAANAAAAPAASPLGGLETIGRFLQMFMDQQQRTADAQLGAVKDMLQRSNDTASRVLEALVQRDDNPRGGFVSQLNEVLEAGRALDNVKKSFGAARSSDRQAKPEAPDDVMTGALKQAVGTFLSGALSSATRPRVPPPAVNGVPQQRPAPRPPGRIPEATSTTAGQPQRKN